MTKFARLLLLFVFVGYGAAVTAQGFQPSPEQIEQFRQMSPAQQRQLAESMGIDVDSMIQQQMPQASTPQAEVSGPRGRQQRTQGSSDSDLMSPEAALVTPDEIAALQEAYKNLSQENFDSFFEKAYSRLSRQMFLDIYRRVTGRAYEDRKSVKPFGYELFNLSPDAFMPASDSPVPADYVMGPGDTLVIQLYGKENSTHNLTITREGQIHFPNIGPITVAGLTFSQTREVIANTVAEQMIGVKSSVTMGSLRTIRVFVLGEAVQPGSYTVSSLSTMTNALFASGGITDVGSLRNIQLKRNGKVVTQLDVYDLLLRGDTSKDARLMPGDAIFVPPVGETVVVKGEVKRPAVYELKQESTAASVIELAGGTSSQAHPELTRLERINRTGEKSLITLDLSTSEGGSFAVESGDIIQVASVLEDVEDVITLAGHVKRPGVYAWRQGLSFSDLIPSVEQLKGNPDLDAALIKREVRSTKQTEIHIFSPKEAWSGPGTEQDPQLQERDKIFIFDYETDRTTALEEVLRDLQIQSRYQDRERTVTIAGSIRFPGDYPIAENMTVDELIALAGGLTESALGTEAELTRYDVDNNRKRVVVHIPVNLENPQQKLMPGDTLRIKQIPLWQEKETVEIRGEVLFPGTYSILPGETLNQVLERAGGLTEHAYPRGAIFSRADLRQLERERLMDLRQKLEADIAAASVQEGQPSVSEAEANRLLSNLSEIDAVGRMVIDLPRVIKAPEAHDFQLEDGDTLTIPRYKSSVTVVGEVQHPTSHFFDANFDALDYIARSGGTKESADDERIYIVKANGQVVLPERSRWFKPRSSQIEPGDTVVVPIDTDRVDPIAMWSSVTQIMYQAALGIAAISSL